jgi:RNA polymerase sigma-70 factor (ECF subfamily)
LERDVPDRDDEDLVRRSRGGDHDAFRQLYERYHRRAYSVAMGIVRNPEDAKEVVQEAFVKVHGYLGAFRGSSSFYTWLYRIVHNLAIDRTRRSRVQHVEYQDQLARDEVPGDAALLPSTLGMNPGAEMERTELRACLESSLAALSGAHRAVLLLREVEGLSYTEMARTVGCAKGTIMSRLFHARRRMQRLILECMGQRTAPGSREEEP